jgi:hypothetical protein
MWALRDAFRPGMSRAFTRPVHFTSSAGFASLPFGDLASIIAGLHLVPEQVLKTPGAFHHPMPRMHDC